MRPELLCLSCMSELNSEQQRCGFCGLINEEVSNQPNQLHPGTILAGKYLVGKAIGQGGFGITYVGYNLNLDKKVAIKEYYPEGFVGREQPIGTTVVPMMGEKKQFFLNGKDKFIEEAKTLAKFSDAPGIVTVHDFFKENNTAYIIMDFVEGQTIKQLAIESRGKLSSSRVLHYVLPLLESLSQVHKQGLLHRDISPDNIIITPNGNPVLLDFGAARQISAQGEHSNTINVKHGFAPEEQYRTRGNQGPWSDVYALCATMYYLTTGKVPPQAMDRMMGDAELLPPNRLGADWIPSQEKAILKGLSIKGTDRQQSTSELKADLCAELELVKKKAAEEAKCQERAEKKRIEDEKKADKREKRVKKRNEGKNPKKKKSKALLVGCLLLLLIVSTLTTLLINNKQSAVNVIETGTYVSDFNTKETIESNTEETAKTEPYTALIFGMYEQDNNAENGKEPIEWIVLKTEGNKALVISKYALDCKPYSIYGTGTTWQDCSLRGWLNEIFISNAFNSDETKSIYYTEVHSEENINSTNQEVVTEDRIFVLSIKETKEYFSTNDSRKCLPTGYANSLRIGTEEKYCNWWLRSNQLWGRASCVEVGGGPRLGWTKPDNKTNCVRPAMWINLTNVGDIYSCQEYGNKVSYMYSTSEEDELSNKAIENSAIEQYETVLFGSYEQDNNLQNGKEPIEWLILEEKQDNVLLVSRDLLDAQPYSNNYQGNKINWNECSLRYWLSSSFYKNAFTKDEKDKIQTFINVSGEIELSDKVFILSMDEIDKYFISREERKAYGTPYCMKNYAKGLEANKFSKSSAEDINIAREEFNWWVRVDIKETSGFEAPYINVSGLSNGTIKHMGNLAGVRPAIYVDKSVIYN